MNDHSNPSADELRTQLQRLLSQDLAFEDFWDWLQPLQLALPRYCEAWYLLYAVLGRFDEHAAGHLTDDELFLRLRQLTQVPTDTPEQSAVPVTNHDV